jgi:hypothetical protein
MTHFLRFPDESAWTAAATDAGYIVDDTLAAYTHGRAIDVVGQIPDTTGFHVNFSGELPDGWDDHLVEPVNPYRVFA